MAADRLENNVQVAELCGKVLCGMGFGIEIFEFAVCTAKEEKNIRIDKENQRMLTVLMFGVYEEIGVLWGGQLHEFDVRGSLFAVFLHGFFERKKPTGQRQFAHDRFTAAYNSRMQLSWRKIECVHFLAA